MNSRFAPGATGASGNGQVSRRGGVGRGEDEDEQKRKWNGKLNAINLDY